MFRAIKVILFIFTLFLRDLKLRTFQVMVKMHFDISYSPVGISGKIAATLKELEDGSRSHLSYSTCVPQAHDELLRSTLMPLFSREIKCVWRYLSEYN